MLLKLHISAIKSTTHDSATGQLNKAFNQQAACFSGYVAFGGKTVSLPLGSAAVVRGLSIIMERKQNLMLHYVMLCCVLGHCIRSLSKSRHLNKQNSRTAKQLRLS